MKQVWPQTARALTARADSSPCLDRGMNVVAIGVDVFNGSLTGGVSCTVTSVSGGTTQSGPKVIIPINTMVATRGGKDDMRTCFGVGDPGDPQFTVSAAHSHGVCYEKPTDCL